MFLFISTNYRNITDCRSNVQNHQFSTDGTNGHCVFVGAFYKNLSSLIKATAEQWCDKASENLKGIWISVSPIHGKI